MEVPAGSNDDVRPLQAVLERQLDLDVVHALAGDVARQDADRLRDL